LTVADDRHVLGILGIRFGGVALEFPSGIGDLLLHLTKFRGFIAFALLFTRIGFLAFARRGLALAINLVEGPDLGEIHVTGGAAWLAVGRDVVRPHVIRNELVRLHTEILQR